MGDSIEIWRARIGIFGGPRKVRGRRINATNTNRFIVMLVILAVLSTFFLTNNTHGFLGSFQKAPELDSISLIHQDLLNFVPTGYGILLFTTKPKQKYGLTGDVKQKISLLILVVSAAILKTLLIRGGIEPNPGPNTLGLMSEDNTTPWIGQHYYSILPMSFALFNTILLRVRMDPNPGLNTLGLILPQVKTPRLKCTEKANFMTYVHQFSGVVISLAMLLLSALILKTLLLRGGIELNPGPFPCRLCSAVPETIVSSVRHQHFHAKNKTYVYYCPSEECIFRTSSFNSMNFHVSKLHRHEKHVDPEMTEKISCICKIHGNACEFLTTSFWELVQHFCNHIDNGIEVQCPVSGCDFEKYFRCKKYFRTHLSQQHPGWKDEGCPKEEFKVYSVYTAEPSFNANVLPDDAFACFGEHEEPNGDGNSANSDLLNDKLILDTIAKFYLHMYAVNLLPETTIQEICDSLTFLTEVVHSRIKLVVKSELRSLNIPEDQVNMICFKILKADLLFTSHHKSSFGPSFTSHHLRTKYFEKHLGYLPPIQINLEEHNPNSKKILQYVPPVKTLSKLLEDPSVQKELDTSFARQNNVTNEIKNFTDGSLFKSEDHPPKEIHLFVYQDSFNPVMNALGSAKNKYKDLVVYFTIGNFQAHLRSKIVSKNFILIVRESVFKLFGAEKCLKELVADLKTLELTGILYKGEIVKVVVQFMIGDSLGQHLIGGFIECFSATYMCRFCDMVKAAFVADPSKTKPQRSVVDYNRCVLRAKMTGKSSKGIKKGCELNSLKYFHATSHLVPCAGHDLFEGCISWDLAGIIARFVQKKWFTYKLLNKRINQFKCMGIDSTNKPANVQKKGEKLGGHAVQNWLLLRLFYFIIGDRINDFDDPGWQLYLKMKELCEYFCAPSFSTSVVPYLKDVLIPAYFDLRKSVLCNVKYNLRPKHHYMAHYPELMLRYGPLIHLWTLSFEQKHKFFKQLIRNTQNFINPEYSCAVRQQMNFSYITSSTLYDHLGFVESKSKPLCSNSFSGELAHFISNHNLCGFYESERVCLDGITYKKNDVLLLSDCGSCIKIGVVKVLATKEELLTFIIEERSALYDFQKGIYHIDLDALGNIAIVSPKHLKYPVPQPIYFYGGQSCFSLKVKLVQIDSM